MIARCAIAAVLIGCHTPPPDVAPLSNRAPATGAYAATSEFHVAVHEPAAGWTNPPAFWLCPIEGATFVCGTKTLLAVRGPNIVADPALATGRPPGDGVVETVVGRWPDDAWLIVRTEVATCIHCDYVAYRWQRDRWVATGRFASQVPITGGGALGDLAAAWRGELYVIVVGAPGPPLQVVSAHPSDLAQRIVQTSRCTGDPSGLAAIAATTDTLFVVGAACDEAGGDVARWTANASQPQLDRVTDAAASLNITATGRGVALFGGLFGEDAPVLHHFDGHWAPDAGPLPRGTLALSYARAPDGTEWMVVEDTIGRDPMVRGADRRWRAPDRDVRAATAAYGKTPRLGRLWIAEGSVWLEVFVEGDCRGPQGCAYRSLLLRTGATSGSRPLARDRGP